MKIILDVQPACNPVPTGIAWYVVNLVNSLLARTKNDYILAFFDKDGVVQNRIKYIDMYFGMHSPALQECNKYSYKEIMMSGDKAVWEKMSYNKYIGVSGDIFHFMLPLWLPEKLDGRMVVTVHDLIAALYPDKSLSDQNTANCVRGLDFIRKERPICIADSLATKSELCNSTGVLPENVFVVPLAYNPDLFFPEEDDDELRKMGINHPYFLFAGTVDDPRKGAAYIIDAFEKIAVEHDNLLLVFAGDYGNRKGMSELKERLDRTQFFDRIIFTGFVSSKQLRNLMSGAIVFVYPSEMEGFGLPVLEAMACGAPVITSNTSSLPEVAGDAAILIDPSNAEQLAYEIERVLTSETLRKDLAAKGFENCKRFSWDKTAEMTEKVYDIAVEM